MTDQLISYNQVNIPAITSLSAFLSSLQLTTTLVIERPKSQIIWFTEIKKNLSTIQVHICLSNKLPEMFEYSQISCLMD